MNKRKFTAIERFAIWKCHEERCWLCTEPLSYKETSIDHFFPENLLEDDKKRLTMLHEYGLVDENFNINGFENWLPSHIACNQRKATKTLNFMPGNSIVLDNLIKKSAKVRETVKKLSDNKKKDKIFASLLIAIEIETITFGDLLEFIKPISDSENIQFIPKDLILLSNGYWVHKNDVAREGPCECEKKHCVDSNKKVYCYFTPNLSSWVIKAGLYQKCYDEIITCPRCKKEHRRGHIGKKDICGVPFKNQEMQKD